MEEEHLENSRYESKSRRTIIGNVRFYFQAIIRPIKITSSSSVLLYVRRWHQTVRSLHSVTTRRQKIEATEWNEEDEEGINKVVQVFAEAVILRSAGD